MQRLHLGSTILFFLALAASGATFQDRAQPLKGPRTGGKKQASAFPASWHPSLCAIRGSVVWSGSPASGVEVEVFHDEQGGWIFSNPLDRPAIRRNGVPSRATTDSSGNFVVSHLYPRPPFTIWFDRCGPLATRVIHRTPCRRGGEVDLGVIVLSGGGSVRGRIEDEDGRAVSDASIRAFSDDELERQNGVPFPNRVNLIVMRNSDELEWTAIRIEPQPSTPTFLDRPRVRSNDEGDFRLSGSLRHDDRIVIQHPCFQTSIVGPFQIRADRECEVGTVVLQTGRLLAGRVVDSSGRPVAGARVFAGNVRDYQPGDGRLDLETLLRLLQSDPDSELLWEVLGGNVDSTSVERDEEQPAQAGRLLLRTSTDGKGRFFIQGLHPEDDAVAVIAGDASGFGIQHPVVPDTDDLRITLAGSREMTVRLLDGESQPVAGGRLQLKPLIGRLPSFLGISQVPDVAGVVTTPEPGIIRVTGLLPGRYWVSAWAPDRVVALFEVDVVAVSAETAVTLRSGDSLRLRLVDAAGAPVESVEASVVSTRSGQQEGFELWSRPEAVVLSGADGRVRLSGLPPGWYLVSLRHPRYAPSSVHLKLPADEVEVVMTAGGRIVSRRNRELVDLAKARSVDVAGSGFFMRITTDRHGDFEIDRLSPGEYTLTLVPDPWGWSEPERGRLGMGRPIDPNAESLTLEVTDGGTGEVAFRSLDPSEVPSGRVRGRVIVNGHPASFWRVELDPHDSDVRGAWRQTDSEGRFDFGQVPAGRVSVSVAQPDVPVNVFPFHLVASSLLLEDGQEEQVEFDFRTGRVRGRVVNGADGEPVVGAKVALFCEHALDANDPEIGGRVDMVTDHAGEFMIDPLVAGVHCIQVEAEGYMAYRHPEQISVGEGDEPSDLLIVLGRGAVVRGRVELPEELEGERPHGVRLYDQRFDNEWDADGLMQNYCSIEEPSAEFEITGVIPGEYFAQVFVTGPTDVEKIPLFITPEGLDGTVLRPTVKKTVPRVQVSGRLVLPEGVPRLVTTLFFRRTDVEQDDERVDVRSPEYHFRRSLLPGSYVVFVLPHWESVQPLRVDVPADGLTGSVLTFQPADSQDQEQ